MSKSGCFMGILFLDGHILATMYITGAFPGDKKDQRTCKVKNPESCPSVISHTLGHIASVEGILVTWPSGQTRRKVPECLGSQEQVTLEVT